MAHPELGSAPGPYTIERKPGIFEPALHPTREEVYKFLDTFFGEMAGLFPDAYLHIGGDENEGKQWDLNLQIQAFMESRASKIITHSRHTSINVCCRFYKKHGKIMMGWDEIFSLSCQRRLLFTRGAGRPHSRRQRKKATKVFSPPATTLIRSSPPRSTTPWIPFRLTAH